MMSESDGERYLLSLRRPTLRSPVESSLKKNCFPRGVTVARIGDSIPAPGVIRFMKRAFWVLLLPLCALCAEIGAMRMIAADTPVYDASLFKGMKWRLVGPFRGGRVLAVTGVSGQPDVFYFGAVSGGVWKSTDGGQRWEPLADKEPIVSVGSIAVPGSDPNVIYVGTGEGCP